MTKNKAQNLVLKVLMISHGYYFVSYGNKTSGCLLIFCFFIFFFKKVATKVDNFIESFVVKLGSLLFKTILLFAYIVVIIPLSFFRKKEQVTQSSFKNINKTEVNFKRPW